jgi:hypothetical protein
LTVRRGDPGAKSGSLRNSPSVAGFVVIGVP